MPDDASHALLRRGHAVAQLDLESFGDARRRQRLEDSATPYTVGEVESKTVLTPFSMGSASNGCAWSLNPYVGCSHACVYCYVPDVVKVERTRWGTYVLAKRNLPTLLAHEVRTKPKGSVFMSSATDCYQAAEATHLVTRRCLEVLVRARWPLRVLTRSPLVLRDLDLLHQVEDLDVGMSVPTLSDEARRAFEPGAPSIEVRLRTLRRLADEGLRPFVNIAPQYPFTTETPNDWVGALRDAGVVAANIMPWRYLDGVLPAMEAAAAGTPYDHFGAHITDRGYQARQAKVLAGALQRAGIFVWAELATKAPPP
ncbi:MAG TPA: radical SAM protein, partial [Candidatus Thermoplasmatota archaeon]|nr:radical SAM protein [Candidatus Thermoplasmatota archaeon]